MTQGPANAVLLAAGQGSRLAPLTDRTHKSLLPVCGKPVLQFIVDRLLSSGCQDIVCVTGYKQHEVEQFLQSAYGNLVRTVHNERYAEDTNVLSTELGVSTLRRPNLGYLIVETDLIMDDAAWDRTLKIAPSEPSFWVTKGRYSPKLTGGALRATESLEVAEIIYAPNYNPRYEGWLKLLGILYVGPAQVGTDRRTRQRAIERSIKQYYMAPWVQNLRNLPCVARDLGKFFAQSYNDLSAYQRAARDYEQI